MKPVGKQLTSWRTFEGQRENRGFQIIQKLFPNVLNSKPTNLTNKKPNASKAAKQEDQT